MSKVTKQIFLMFLLTNVLGISLMAIYSRFIQSESVIPADRPIIENLDTKR